MVSILSNQPLIMVPAFMTQPSRQRVARSLHTNKRTGFLRGGIARANFCYRSLPGFQGRLPAKPIKLPALRSFVGCIDYHASVGLDVDHVIVDDREIRSAIMNALEAQSWAPMTTLNVTVAAGVADVWGTITNEEERRAIHVVVENTPGVKIVHDHMVYIEPYTGMVIDAPDERS
jgi:hypothetical protein